MKLLSNIRYYWSRLLKKLPGSAVRNSFMDYPSKIEAGSQVIDSHFGRYSYCGYNCKILNAEIGSFTSISDGVVIGNSHHPMDWASTSPAFYFGRDSIPKNLARKDFNSDAKKTIIGNDVWIGEHAFIKDGVSVGDGAIIGMGSIVTKDVPPYSIVAGNPAKIIRMRFSHELIDSFDKIKWWNMDIKDIKKVAKYIDNPIEFVRKCENLLK